MEKKINIKRLKELERAERKLRALEAGGVDNWEWYSESLKEISKEEEIEDLTENTLIDLEVALLNGAYEPSERGAGYASSDSGREEALVILQNFVKNVLETSK